MECGFARFASRCGCESSTRPHHCATFHSRCTMTRSNQCFAVATAREPHERRLHARARKLARAWRAR
eukprot:7817591-Lingulodinium_polyedra.AAC.1